ncbi:3-oxoacyl-ACP synthase III family protein [Flavobacterium sp. I3-2]|uniref:3-oxoacyl-ACP synthase III family protein n=1 Tax=Flavobacterium sp. I3-2 TaxID=2748319 RepID=UPI0015B251BB|nr:ketoacyl-ACP synthase III [Flavobacterium sp. I3-2]
MGSKFIGVGSYIPTQTITNLYFKDYEFLNEQGIALKQKSEFIAEKLKDITGIKERKYVETDLVTSDIGLIAAQRAIVDAQIDPETLDYIIFAHNFGDVKFGTIQSDAVPSLAARVKKNLQIKNPKCVAYDLLFGCPGWVEGVIQANAFIKAGIAKRCLIIGAETLSRVVDLHDRDSMIYADGAGAAVLEATTSEYGVIAHATESYTFEESEFIHFGKSYNNDHDPNIRYIKMFGKKIYEFALIHVPAAMKACLEKSGVSIHDIKKILIHQANEKMDEAIVYRFYKLFNMEVPEHIMPMTIGKLGNSSVATIPTLLDILRNKEIDNHRIHKGDCAIICSVGAGMNINAIVYRY